MEVEDCEPVAWCHPKWAGGQESWFETHHVGYSSDEDDHEEERGAYKC